MTDKKWFTTEDVEMAKMTLDSLPDLTEKTSYQIRRIE